MIIEEKHKQAYEGSINLIKSLLAGPEYNSIGFFASSEDKQNYKRLFARDAFWIGMASLVSEESLLVDGFKTSLDTLAAHQREDGAIPSNVSPDGKVSYGIINPRIDPTTLFVIGCVQLYKKLRDKSILDEYYGPVTRAINYLENNYVNEDTGLLFTPRAGNWADEYMQQGFVLYDEVLWHIALRSYADILEIKNKSEASYYREKSEHVKELIGEKFWRDEGYFLHFFFAKDKSDTDFTQPHNIFDAFGNILALISGVATREQSAEIIRFIDDLSRNKYPLIPAHFPFFPEDIFKCHKLHQYRFKEYVGHYHNGGLWCWYTGLYAAYLSKMGDRERALKFLNGIIKANKEKKDGKNYFEYHAGKKAEVFLKVRHDNGIDLFLSFKIAEIAKAFKSTVRLLYQGKKVYADNDMALRSLNIRKGEEVKFNAIGPDAEASLKSIAGISSDEGNCFDHKEIIVKGSRPGGAPYLGVSAAAHIIAHRSFYDLTCPFYFL